MRSTGTANAWFAASEHRALLDFWKVYDAHYTEMQARLQEPLKDHPTFGPILAAMSSAQLAAQNAASRGHLVRAIEHGDWGTYEQQLRSQGAMYAEHGISFADWYDVTRLFQGYLVPKLVAEYGADLPRLTDALGAIRTFTDRLMAEIGQSYIDRKARALQTSEQLLSTTLANIHEGVTVVDAHGKVTFRNRAAHDIVGLGPQNIHLRADYTLYLPDGKTLCPPEQNPLVRALKGEEIRHLEFILKTSDLTNSVTVSVNAGPIHDEAGALAGAVASFRDVTHRSRLEEHRVRGIELEVRNQRLQEASRMKSEFLANMSHELRTPLNAIIGLSKLMHDGRVTSIPKQVEFLGDILSSGKHLLQLINDILDLSKVEAGKMEFTTELVDLGRVITEVTSILRTTAASKQIHIATSVAADLGDVFLDAARFKQVLYNYLSNALKFTPEAGKVSLQVEREGPGHLKLTVSDSGIGISGPDQAKLFVEFEQLQAGASKHYSGTGLGLALTKRLVEAQGGSVGLTSEPAVGSQFFAILPCRDAVVKPKERSHPIPHLARSGAPMVLVVDDDPRDQAIITKALVEAGYGVDVASNGAEALARARDNAYVAITLDLILPDMSGLDVLRAIQANSKNTQVPIVIITVVTEQATAGFTVADVLAKPLEPDALVDALRRAGVVAPLATVLVVDDDPIALKLISEVLDRLHYRPVCYQDGESALRDLGAHDPAAIILDLLMPGLDGFEFLARLRRTATHRQIPVFVWTTKELSIDELALLRSTARAVIQKGASDLIQELGAYLKPGARDGS